MAGGWVGGRGPRAESARRGEGVFGGHGARKLSTNGSGAAAVVGVGPSSGARQAEAFLSDHVIKDSDVVKAQVGDFEFEDINNDGVYELIVSHDFSGRGFINGIMIIYRTDGGFASQGIPSWNPDNYSGHDFSREIIDLNGDGLKEIIAYQPITEYEGAVNPMAFWPSVYRWNGKGYIKADEEFSEFYKTGVIPKLEKK
jgi:hypothetical protein